MAFHQHIHSEEPSNHHLQQTEREQRLQLIKSRALSQAEPNLPNKYGLSNLTVALKGKKYSNDSGPGSLVGFHPRGHNRFSKLSWAGLRDRQSRSVSFAHRRDGVFQGRGKNERHSRARVILANDDDAAHPSFGLSWKAWAAASSRQGTRGKLHRARYRSPALYADILDSDTSDWPDVLSTPGKPIPQPHTDHRHSKGRKPGDPALTRIADLGEEPDQILPQPFTS